MPNRFPQPLGKKGSLKWMQVMVNRYPGYLSEVIGAAVDILPSNIEWVSPLATDEYAEYRDQGFLDRLGVKLDHYPLAAFWPARGPQWDALGKADNRVVLVEAKAHLAELMSPPSHASPASLTRIRQSLDLMKAALGVAAEIDWITRYYQYANRLAHLYLLRHLNHVPAELVHLCFVNDREMNGPASADAWQMAIHHTHELLGIKEHPLLRHMHHVFIDVDNLVERSCGR